MLALINNRYYRSNSLFADSSHLPIQSLYAQPLEPGRPSISPAPFAVSPVGYAHPPISQPLLSSTFPLTGYPPLGWGTRRHLHRWLPGPVYEVVNHSPGPQRRRLLVMTHGVRTQRCSPLHLLSVPLEWKSRSRSLCRPLRCLRDRATKSDQAHRGRRREEAATAEYHQHEDHRVAR